MSKSLVNEACVTRLYYTMIEHHSILVILVILVVILIGLIDQFWSPGVKLKMSPRLKMTFMV